MDQAQSRALVGLQPFVHIAATTKSPSHRFLADLITRAISAPGTYTFTELLQIPAIQSLRAADTPPEYRSHLTLLEIFSYGTYEEYKSTPNLPPLDENQSTKLRQLTLLTLASPASTTHLTYPSLIEALDLPSAESLENLVTTAIYASLITAKLSPTSTPPAVHITSVAPLRDLAPQSLPSLLKILQVWESRCDSVVTSLEQQIAGIRTMAATRNQIYRKKQDVIDTAVLAESKQPQASTSNDGADNGKPPTTAAGGMSLRGRPRPGSKRDLDEQQEDEFDENDGENNSDDGMDVDDGAGATIPGSLGSSGTRAAGGGGGGSGGGRNKKRGGGGRRGRDSSYSG